MKKMTLQLILFCTVLIFLSSCGQSPYKRRKPCKGNGSWYGNRNLGSVEKNAADVYCLNETVQK